MAFWRSSKLKLQSAPIVSEGHPAFDLTILHEAFFAAPNQARCAIPFTQLNGDRCVMYATDDAVYLSGMVDPATAPVKVLALPKITQLDVLEEYQLLVVLSEQRVFSVPLDALDPLDATTGMKWATQLTSKTTFFKVGSCMNEVVVCLVKSSSLSSTIKVLVMVNQEVQHKAKPTFATYKTTDVFKNYKEFYVPVKVTSTQFLKNKICIGSERGFEIVDLESLETQMLLDPADDLLHIIKKQKGCRPITIHRVRDEFLLCYDVFAFYVNKNGRRFRDDFLIRWKGQPTGFAINIPYILAFGSSFVEVWDITTGTLAQVIEGANIKLLFADTPPSIKLGTGHLYPYHQTPVVSGQVRGLANWQQFNQYPQHPQGIGRTEIIVYSNEQVLTLTRSPPPAVDRGDESETS